LLFQKFFRFAMTYKNWGPKGNSVGISYARA
jgi:hypothetical protein